MRIARAALLAVVTAHAALAQQTPSLAELKGTYETARSQIEAAATAAYSNSLVLLDARIKAAGDVDGYLSLRSEQSRVSAGGSVAAGVTNVSSAVADAARKASAAKDVKIASLLRAYVARLDTAVKQSLMSGDVDTAKLAKDSKDVALHELGVLEAHQRQAKDAPPTPARTEPAGSAPNPSTMPPPAVVAKWLSGNGYLCEILPAGEATYRGAKGKWQLTANHLVLRWDNGYIDTYDWPSQGGVLVGTNHLGRAVKLTLQQ